MRPDIKQLLMGTLDDIERGVFLQATHPVHFNMEFWIQHFDRERADWQKLHGDAMVEPCETHACLAGHLALRLGWPRLPHTHEQFISLPMAVNFTPDSPLYPVVRELVVEHANDETIRIDPGETIRRYLDVPEPAWLHLVITQEWPRQFQHAYRQAKTESQRIAVTRDRVRAWLADPNESYFGEE